MLVLIVVLMIISTVVIAASRKDRLSFYLIGLCASLVVMMCGIITYIAKMGGYDSAKIVFLFLMPSIQKMLRDSAIPLGQLGYLVAIGRCMFPLFLVYIGIYHTHITWVRRHEKALCRGHLAITLVFLIYYFPAVFRGIVDGKYDILVSIRRVILLWIVFCICEAMFLMGQEYYAITSPYFKRNYRFVLLAMISVTALYAMYAIQDPGQIYWFYVSEYVRIGSLSYLQAVLSNRLGWLLIAACTVFFVGLGTVNLISFSRVGQSEHQEEAVLQRKFDTASMGASVFVHSVKNQLLSARVINKKLGQELAKEQPDMERVKELSQKLSGMNETMLQRMEELYRNIKVNYISLTPIDSQELVQAALDRLHQKYPEAEVTVDMQTQDMVLVDRTHMAEALYNLLTNAWESACAVEHKDKPIVLFTVRGERLWLDFDIADNGCGMSRAQQKRIFDPFYTSKNTNFNWGMGLYYVRQITRSHLGHMQIRSVEGRGSTFTIMLPRYVPGRTTTGRKRAMDI